MEKLEYDMDHHNNSAEDDPTEILGMVDENSLASQDNILQAGEEDVQYSFRNGDQMMAYRVVQLGEDTTTDQIMTTQGNGQFYVISNPTPEFVSTTTSHKAITPKITQNSNVRTPAAPSIKKRDEKRRATHNEVERRRRDKINTWILKLGAIIPEATTADMRSGTGGHFEGLSKGGILAKACEYITSLKDKNSSLSECLKDNEKIALENVRLRENNERLRRDNGILRAQILQHGIVPVSDNDIDS